MKALLLALVLGFLVLDAAGVTALVSPESCTSWSDTAPDGKCPPQCTRCACGVPSVVSPPASLAPALLIACDNARVYVAAEPDAPPHEILHVPRQ
ncbi:MAG: hypothetical protein U0Q11_26760 [Vicinamibacterales bacterium]|mgnify:CR=1 FL=1